MLSLASLIKAYIQQTGSPLLACLSSNDFFLTEFPTVQRSLLASRSDSSRARISPFLTGPFTLRTKVLSIWPWNLTLTCVIPPLEPKYTNAPIKFCLRTFAHMTLMELQLSRAAHSPQAVVSKPETSKRNLPVLPMISSTTEYTISPESMLKC